VTVADPSDALIDVEGDEYETAQVRAGQAATVYFDAFGPQPATGSVTQTPTVRRARSGSGSPAIFGFSVALGSVPDWAKLGMTARVEIVTARRADALVVPLDAVVRVRGRSVVLVREGRAVRPVEVTLGLQDDWTVEVLRGVSAGDHLLIDAPDVMNRIALR
jgi:HlyD family secretion protein